MRSELDKTEFEVISERFLEVANKELGLSLSSLARQLGYQNPSPLTKVKKGEGFIGPDKLKTFALLKNNNGDVPNLNWIFTGIGERMIRPVSEDMKLGNEIVASIGREKAKLVLDLFE